MSAYCSRTLLCFRWSRSCCLTRTERRAPCCSGRCRNPRRKARTCLRSAPHPRRSLLCERVGVENPCIALLIQQTQSEIFWLQESTAWVPSTYVGSTYQLQRCSNNQVAKRAMCMSKPGSCSFVFSGDHGGGEMTRVRQKVVSFQ